MKGSYKIILHSIAIVVPIGLIAAPIIHIKNKSKEAIQIQINNGPLKNIAAGNDLSDDTNVPDISVFNIYYCAQKNCGNNKDQLQATFSQVNKDTTLYVKFDVKNGKGVLEPQKGDWFGKSTEKYSLSKNIKASNINQRIVKSARSASGTPSTTPYTFTAGREDDIQAKAWEQFPEANKLRKARVPEPLLTQYDTYPKEVWFKVLGASPTTPKSELRTNYKKLALKWHPDRNQDNEALAEQVMKILSEVKTKLDLL